MIDSVTTTKSTSTDTSTQPVEKTTEVTAVSAEFDELMRSMLQADGSGQVSEEQLFSAACGEKISALKGSDALEKYKAALETQRATLRKADGFVPEEEAAIGAMKQLVTDGVLTQEEGDSIYTKAFNAAQLDADTTSLFDHKGGVNDPTTAMALLSDAIKKASDATASVTELGESSMMSLATASATGGGGAAKSLVTGALSLGGSEVIDPNGTYVDGSKGFLFKPVSNNEGTLAILGAQEWTYNISSVSLYDSLGNLLETGTQQLEGVSETGQEKWRFSKEGGSYPDNLSVQIVMKDGSVKTYNIADPSKRYD